MQHMYSYTHTCIFFKRQPCFDLFSLLSTLCIFSQHLAESAKDLTQLVLAHMPFVRTLDIQKHTAGHMAHISTLTFHHDTGSLLFAIIYAQPCSLQTSGFSCSCFHLTPATLRLLICTTISDFRWALWIQRGSSYQHDKKLSTEPSLQPTLIFFFS